MLSPAAFPSITTSPDDSFVSWDLSEMFSDELPENPVLWSPGSENPPPRGHATSNSNSNFGSNNSDLNSNSDCADQADPLTDQRKRRRMISNRESARRSRMRKQKHLEDLTSEVNQLKFENTRLSNQLQSALCHCHRLSSDNEHLRLEHSILWEKLRGMTKFTLLQHLQQRPSPASCPSNEPPLRS